MAARKEGEGSRVLLTKAVRAPYVLVTPTPPPPPTPNRRDAPSAAPFLFTILMIMETVQTACFHFSSGSYWPPERTSPFPPPPRLQEALFNEDDLEASMQRIEVVDFYQTIEVAGMQVRSGVCVGGGGRYVGARGPRGGGRWWWLGGRVGGWVGGRVSRWCGAGQHRGGGSASGEGGVQQEHAGTNARAASRITRHGSAPGPEALIRAVWPAWCGCCSRSVAALLARTSSPFFPPGGYTLIIGTYRVSLGLRTQSPLLLPLRLQITPYRAGHVLGAAMFLVEVAGCRCLYTGDYSRLPDRHLPAADIPPVKPHIGELVAAAAAGASGGG